MIDTSKTAMFFDILKIICITIAGYIMIKALLRYC